MTKIHLTIGADSAEEFQSVINALAMGGVEHRLAGALPAQQPALQNEDPGPAPQADEKPKRKRRTKAEIEAEKAAHDEKQAEKGDPARDSGDDATSTAAPTRQDVDDAMRALVEANGGSQMLELLKELGAVNAEGNLKTSALDEAKYGEAIEKAGALVADLKAKSEQAGSLLE